MMLLGMCVSVLPTVLQLCFNDDLTLGTESDSVHRIRQKRDEARGQLTQPLLADSNAEDCGASYNRSEDQDLDVRRVMGAADSCVVCPDRLFFALLFATQIGNLFFAGF